MFGDVLTQLGLAKNEAKIYETLLTEGEISVGEISTKSKVHRRNVYDSLNRLMEKGLVFEIKSAKENHYKAVNPKKLSEILAEKDEALQRIMPKLQSRYASKPHSNEIYIYRGLEGWKNYLNDMLAVGKDIHTIGAKGTLTNPKLNDSFTEFLQQAKAKNMQFFLLCDDSLRGKDEILTLFDKNYRFLPKKFQTASTIDIFGDHVVIFSGLDGIDFDEDASFTVVVNPEIADSFRMWFHLLWAATEGKIPTPIRNDVRQTYPNIDFRN